MFAGSALVRRVTPAEINPSWLTAKPLPPSEGVALDWWSQVGNEALRILEGELRCLKMMAMPSHHERQLGDHERVREPARFDARDIWMDGPIWRILERAHPVLLNRVGHTTTVLTDEARGLTLPKFSSLIIEPAMIQIARSIFADGRNADLIVTAPLVMPPMDCGLCSSVTASGDRLHLQANVWEDWAFVGPKHRSGERLAQFSVLYGALRAS